MPVEYVTSHISLEQDEPLGPAPLRYRIVNSDNGIVVPLKFLGGIRVFPGVRVGMCVDGNRIMIRYDNSFDNPRMASHMVISPSLLSNVEGGKFFVIKQFDEHIEIEKMNPTVEVDGPDEDDYPTGKVLYIGKRGDMKVEQVSAVVEAEPVEDRNIKAGKTGLYIPTEFLKSLGLRDRDAVSVVMFEGKVIIRPDEDGKRRCWSPCQLRISHHKRIDGEGNLFKASLFPDRIEVSRFPLTAPGRRLKDENIY